MKIETEEQFVAAAEEWLAIEYELNDDDWDESVRRRMVARQVEIERAQDESGFEFDEAAAEFGW